jgi:hypothetical protein
VGQVVEQAKDPEFKPQYSQKKVHGYRRRLAEAEAQDPWLINNFKNDPFQLGTHGSCL